MGTDNGKIPEGTVDAVSEGLQAYFTADAVRQLLEAIDIESALEGELDEESVDSEAIGRVIGRLIGRMVAKELTSYVPLGQLIESTVGRMVGEKLGEAAVNTFIEHGDPEAVVDRVQTLINNNAFDEIATDITSTAQESGFRDYLPGIGNKAEETWDPDDSTVIEITDE